MASSFSAFSIGEIFSGIEPIIGSLSPLVSGDASNVKDNNSLMYFPSSVPDVFFSNPYLCHFRNICSYLRFQPFVVDLVLFEPQL